MKELFQKKQERSKQKTGKAQNEQELKTSVATVRCFSGLSTKRLTEACCCTLGPDSGTGRWCWCFALMPPAGLHSLDSAAARQLAQLIGELHLIRRIVIQTLLGPRSNDTTTTWASFHLRSTDTSTILHRITSMCLMYVLRHYFWNYKFFSWHIVADPS